MKTLKKAEFKEKYGSYTDIYLNVKYIGGLPSKFDEFKKQPIDIQRLKKNHFAFAFMLAFSYDYITIHSEDINFINILTPEKKKKKKSVLGRALLGGLLLGPLGAVVGGISGIGEKELKGVDNLVTFSFNYDNEERKILIDVKDKKLKSFNRFLQKHKLTEILKSTEEINSKKTETASVADELKKLKSLMDEGVINEEEFIEQKNKLLK
jgi:hypothetical protein